MKRPELSQEEIDRDFAMYDEWRRKYAERVKNFQAVFGKYLPSIRDNDREAEVIYSIAQRPNLPKEQIPVTNMASFEDDLATLKRAIFTIANHKQVHYREGMRDILEDESDNWVVMETANDILKFIDRMNADLENGILVKAWEEYEGYARVSAQDYTYERLNINWEAVEAVRHLRRAWYASTGREAPERALNPASPFADYLRDGFSFFEIKGDPMSAFKRWAALLRKNGGVL